MSSARAPRVRKSTSATTSTVIPIQTASRVRWSRVMTAQARIAVGYYDREEVKEKVLDALLKELARH